MTSFLLYYVSGNSERMIFNKNIISNNDQAPFLIPGHEEKCLVVLGCCGFASRMLHAYPKSPILRAFTVAKEIGFTIKSVLWRFRKVCYTSEFRFRGVFYIIGNCISYYMKKPPAGCALRRSMMMSQATAAGARMCQGTFFVLKTMIKYIIIVKLSIKCD